MAATGYVTIIDKPVDPAQFGVPAKQIPPYMLVPGSANQILNTTKFCSRYPLQPSLPKPRQKARALCRQQISHHLPLLNFGGIS